MIRKPGSLSCQKGSWKISQRKLVEMDGYLPELDDEMVTKAERFIETEDETNTCKDGFNKVTVNKYNSPMLARTLTEGSASFPYDAQSPDGRCLLVRVTRATVMEGAETDAGILKGNDSLKVMFIKYRLPGTASVMFRPVMDQEDDLDGDSCQDEGRDGQEEGAQGRQYSCTGPSSPGWLWTSQRGLSVYTAELYKLGMTSSVQLDIVQQQMCTVSCIGSLGQSAINFDKKREEVTLLSSHSGHVIEVESATSGHNHQDNLPAGVEVLVDQQEHKLVLFLQLDEHVQGHEEHGGAHNPSDDDLVQSLEQKHHRGYQQGSLEGYQVHNDRNLKWDNRIQHQPHLSQPGDLLAMAGHQRAHDVTPALQARNVHVQHITKCYQHFERQELCCHYAQPPRHDHNHYPLCQGQQEKAVQVCQGPVRAAQVRLVHHQLSHWESQQNKMYQQALHYRPDKGAQAGHFLLLGGHDGQVSLCDVGDEQPHHPEESPELGHHPYHVHKGAGQQEHNDDISTSGLVQLVKALPHQHHRPQVDNEDQQAEVTPVNVENMFLGLFFSSTCLLSLKTRITADRQHQNHEISPNQEDVQGQFVTAESMPLRLQEVMHCVYTCGTHSGSDFSRELKSADDKPHPGPPLVAEYGRSSLSQQENEFSKFVSLSITVTTSTANTWVKVNTASHISILVYRLDKTSYSLDEVDVTVIFDSELSMPKSNTRHQPPIHKLRCSRSYSLSSEILQSEDGMDHTADKVRVTILVSNESSLTTAMQSSLVNNIQEHGSGYLLPIQCLQHETGQREGNFQHRGHGDVLVPVHDNGDVPHRAGGGQALPHRQHYDKSLCQASRTHLQFKSLITFSEDVIVKMSEDGLVYVGANTMLTVAMLVGSVMYSLPAYSIITVNAIKLL